MLEELLLILFRGYLLLTRNKMLVGFTFLLAALPTVITLGFSELTTVSGERDFLLVLTVSFAIAFFAEPFLKASLVGSYVQILKGQIVSMEQFLNYGKSYYTAFLTLIFLRMAASFPFMYVAKLIFDSSEQPEDKIFWSGFVSLLILIPLSELAPILIVLNRLQPLQSVVESYRLVQRQLTPFLKIIGFFWVFPSILPWTIWGVLPETPLGQLGKSLIWIPFMVLALPTLVIYLSEKVLPVPSSENKIE